MTIEEILPPRALQITPLRIDARTHNPFSTADYVPLAVPPGHWQLRNLVRWDSRDLRRLLCVQDQVITALEPDHTCSEAASFDFKANLFSEKDGIIVAGGQEQQYGKKNLVGVSGPGRTDVSLNVGNDVINAVTCYAVASGAQYVLDVASNDKLLYTLDISQARAEVVNSTNFGYELNHLTRSHDGRMIAVTGDQPTVSLYSPKSGKIFERIRLEDKSWGFSIEFHQLDRFFAAAFQLGLACIYDVRNTSRALHTVESCADVGSSRMAFRHVKFTNFSCDDYLMLSEHVGRVHMIDMRDFSVHKVLTMPLDFGSVDMERGEGVPILEDYDTVFQRRKSKSLSVYDIFGMDWTGSQTDLKLVVGGKSGLAVMTIDSSKRRITSGYELY